MIKYFNREKLIEQIIGEFLTPQNFTFRGNGKRRYWVFSRKKDDVVQKIELVESLSGGSIMLRYCTSLHIYPESITYFLDGLGISLEEWSCYDIHDGWLYSDKESYIKVLTIFRTLIEQYVFAELEKMSVFDTEVRITTKNLLYLKENVDDILKVQAQRFGLEGLSFDERVTVLSQKVESLKNSSFSMAEKDLLHLGTLYGGMIIEKYGGRWVWNEFYNNVLVKVIAKRLIDSMPVYVVFRTWQGVETIEQDLSRINKEIETTELIPPHLYKYYFK